MPNKQLVVINAGSSSIKFAVYEYTKELKKLLSGNVQNITISPVLKIFDLNGELIKEEEFNKETGYDFFYEKLLSIFQSNQFNFDFAAACHRVVHGGKTYKQPVLINKKIVDDLKKLIPFAPLHQPYNIAAIDSIFKFHPNLPQVACFDTSFHRTHPPVADRFGLPRYLIDEGVQRYGFHGLSYEYIMQKLEEINPNESVKRIVVAHLGNGASMCAIKNKESIDSTMGFTALDGLIMGTRCGNLDPGVVLYLMKYKNMSYDDIENTLYKKSGLIGVSAISSDMEKLLNDSNEYAKEAIDLFVYRIRYALGALVAILGGLDTLIFTGGIGENAWQIREKVCDDFDWLGIRINASLNTTNQPIISDTSSQVIVRIIPTNEEWVIANHSFQLLNR
jgi:acetate kinase